jgi:prepilin-type N-terminal cleavage/methylation domain-containing protein
VDAVSRLRTQDGFTLPELLTAISMSVIVLLGAFGVLDTVMSRTVETQARVEATQRARQALDVMTRQLRSQVCLDATTPAIAEAEPNRVTFYADLSDGTAALSERVEKRVLSYDPAAGRIYESVYEPTGADPIAFPAVPDSTRELARNVVTDGAAPIFRYYAFTPATSTAKPQPTAQLVSPDAAGRGRIARVELAFAVRPGRTAEPARGGITLRDEVFVRSVDPNDYDPTNADPTLRAPRPTCV